MGKQKLFDISDEQASVISRCFSSSIFRQFGKTSCSSMFGRLVKQSGVIDRKSTETVADFLDSAFIALDRPGYRNEYVYKSLLLHKILLGRHSINSATMLTEFRVGDCRADAVVLNGTSTAYEVKSERDDIHRLVDQVCTYGRVFARVCVLADDCHIGQILSIVPKHVGVLRISKRRSISVVKEPVEAPKQIDLATMFDSLRRREAETILRAHGVSVPVVPNTEAYTVLRTLFMRLSPVDAHESMVRVLRESRSLSHLSMFIARLPRSLHAAAISVPLNQQERRRVVGTMGVKMSEVFSW